MVQEGLKANGAVGRRELDFKFQMGEALGAQLLEAGGGLMGKLDLSATKLLESKWLGEVASAVGEAGGRGPSVEWGAVRGWESSGYRRKASVLCCSHPTHSKGAKEIR